jgi:hypothetical protein
MEIIKHQDENGKFDGREIYLAETNDISKLKNQLMTLGFNGLFYSPLAKDIREKIHRLENEEKK